MSSELGLIAQGCTLKVEPVDQCWKINLAGLKMLRCKNATVCLHLNYNSDFVNIVRRIFIDSSLPFSFLCFLGVFFPKKTERTRRSQYRSLVAAGRRQADDQKQPGSVQ